MFNQAQQEYAEASNELKYCEDKTQDIIHELELVKHTYAERGRLTDELIEIRKRRRIAKNATELLLPLTTWFLNQQKSCNALRNVLGDMRKIETKHANRLYYKRADDKGEIIK